MSKYRLQTNPAKFNEISRVKKTEKYAVIGMVVYHERKEKEI